MDNTNKNTKNANDKAADKNNNSNRTEFADEIDSTNKKSGNK